MNPDTSSLPLITTRSVVLDLALSLLLCAMNSYLTLSFGVFAALSFYVVGNDEDGFGWFHSELALPGLAAVSGAIALSPFAIGGSHLMGLRTCVGFLADACLPMCCKRWMPLGPDESPHLYDWPLAPDGRDIYGLKRHWRDGTSAVSFDPPTFIERLAALVLPPRSHQLTYHGVLAQTARLRLSRHPVRRRARSLPATRTSE